MKIKHILLATLILIFTFSCKPTLPESAKIPEEVKRELPLKKADLTRSEVIKLIAVSQGKLILAGVNLHGLDLSDLAFMGQILSRANLSGADLSRANFIEADLRQANLNGADLRGARLQGADLTGADLTGANLEGVDLKEVILTEEKALEYRNTKEWLEDAEESRRKKRQIRLLREQYP